MTICRVKRRVRDGHKRQRATRLLVEEGEVRAQRLVQEQLRGAHHAARGRVLSHHHVRAAVLNELVGPLGEEGLNLIHLVLGGWRPTEDGAIEGGAPRVLAYPRSQ